MIQEQNLLRFWPSKAFTNNKSTVTGPTNILQRSKVT